MTSLLLCLAIGVLRFVVNTLASMSGGMSPKVSVTDLNLGKVPARLYRPGQGSEFPPIVFFHGGGFVTCGINTHDSICRRLAQGSGAPVVAIAYRLAPEWPHPAQLEDALDGCNAVLQGHEILGPKPKGIWLSGDSAGGYLAMRCALDLNQDATRVLGQMLFYPLVSMDRDVRSRPMTKPTNFMRNMALGLMRRALGDQHYPSLCQGDLSKAPYTIVISGRSLDPVSEDGLGLVEALRREGAKVEHIILPKLFHGALNFAGVSPTASEAMKKATEAIKSRLP